MDLDAVLPGFVLTAGALFATLWDACARPPDLDL
jgi:hypothetical protein